MPRRPERLTRSRNHVLVLICLYLVALCLPGYGQTRNLTVAVLINSQNTAGYNPATTSPGEFQRFAERYLEHLQVPYQLFDVSTVAPPSDLDSRQLIITGHPGLNLSAAWRNAIVNAVNGGTGFVNLDSHPAIGTESHIANIFGATGSTAGTPATQITVPAGVAPGGATPHYITALQKKFDSPTAPLTYPFHAAEDGIIRTATSTVLLNVEGTVIANLGNDPLIVAVTHGSARAVHFGTLDYLRADRFGFVMGVDDLFWRSLVWAARKPFALRGYPRLWAVQIDDTRVGFGTRVRDMYDPAFTGTASGDGRGGPWKVTGYLFTNNLAAGGAERAGVIADINAGKLEIVPHSFAELDHGNIYWNPTTGPLTDQQWQTNMAGIDAWKQGNGGADTIPSFSRALVGHFWHMSNNTGDDLWNRYGFRYITSIIKPGFWARRFPGGAERLPVKPFWNYEMPPKTFQATYTSEDFHFFFADDYPIGSRAGLPPRTLFLFATQYLDYARYQRVDYLFPKASPTSLTPAESIALLQQTTWRFWSGMMPLQLFTHDAINYQNGTQLERRAVITQSSAWLNANGVRHVFMDDLGDYIFARSKSKLTGASFDGVQLAYTFTGTAATADGALVPTQLLLFQGDTEGAWQSIPGFSNGLQVNRSLPPSIESIAPTSGLITGGTSVTITGEGFTPESTVYFGQNSATSVTFVNSSTLQVVTPPAGEGGVEVRVVNVNGTAAVQSGFTYVPPPRLLVAAYSFDEGTGTLAGDSSGHGNNGVITGATWTTAGRFGKALSFNGTSNWVTVNDANSLDMTTGITIEAWVFPTAATNWRTIVFKEQTAGLVYGLYSNTDTNRPSGHVFLTTEIDTRGTAALPTNTWSHVAMTYDGSMLRLYVNGTEVSNRLLAGNIQTSTGALRIGGNSVWTEFFGGVIDEVRIFDRVSTPAEILSDMNTPVGDATPPSVAMTGPANGATVSGTVTVSANASDNSGVAGVQFLLDGAPLGAEDTSAPYSISWNSATIANGPHTLAARARDGVGLLTTSSPVNVTVSNAPDTTPPNVAMTAPAEGATVSGIVTVSADASDNAAVAGVQFLLNGAPLGGEDTTAPYSISWNAGTAAAGPHTLSARARDVSNNTNTSPVVNVTNVPPDTTSPTVAITAPANGTIVSGPVTVSADASDNVGVVGVQFLLDGAPLGTEDTSAPYSVSWNSATATNGLHNLTARARDAAGNSTTSGVVAVTVTGGLANGLVAAYGFDEGSGTTVSDASGSGNNGTISGPTWATTGRFGKALSFSGTTGNWVTVNDSASLDLTNGMTVEAWVNPAALGTAWRTVVMKEQTGGLIYGLYANTNTTRPSANVFTTQERETRGPAALPLNTWTHLAMTYNGSNVRLYVNGAEVSNLALTGNLAVSTGALRIGGNAVWGENFSGLIDEVRVYNRALSASEIQADMNLSVAAPDTAAPTVSMTAPSDGATVSGLVTVSANANDNVGVAGVQFLLNGVALGNEDTTAPYTLSWDSRTVANGPHTLAARARDAANNQTTSTVVNVTTANDFTPPAVSMTNPANGATVSEQITLSADASDNVGVVGVQFLLNGSPVGAEDTTAPYSINWNTATVANGSHSLAARARDAVGLQTTSTAVNVTVSNAPEAVPPQVSMTAPADGATVTGNVTVSANASDNVGVVGVQFLLDGNPLGNEDTSAPYSITWNAATATAGPHTLAARARDAADNQATSAVVNVTNVIPDTTPPSVSITSPAGGATVSGEVTVSADASDNVGVVGVQFFLDGAPLGSEDTSAPYSVSWNSATASNGSHTLTARARDAATNSTTSTGVTVTVTGGVASGLVAAYGLNEGTGTTTADSSGNANHGTLTNGPTWTTGRHGNGVNFDGTNDNVTIPNSATLALGSTGTVEAWVRLNTANRWNAVIAKGTANDDRTHNYSINISNTNRVLCVLGNGTAFRTLTSTAVLTVGQFNHLACVWNGTTLQLYVNGVLDASVAQNLTPAANTAPVTIGQFGGNSDQLAGVVDEVRLYSRALSAAEIQSDMNTPVGGTPPPPPPDSTPPTVSVTAPLNGATVSGTISLSANASDNVGVLGVQFFVNGNAVGDEDTTAPYSVSWNTSTVANGSYNITARARDAVNQTTSSPISVTVSNTAPPPPAGGLVAAYGFDEGSGTTVIDASGNSNNGAITDATWSTAGRFGNALSFNGTSAWVTVNDAVSLDLTTGMTVEAWVNPAALGTAWRTVVMKEQAGGLAYGLYANTNTGLPAANIFITAEHDTRGPATLPLNTWSHLAMTYDGTNLRLYVNGAEVNNLALGGSILVSTGALRIGGNSVWGERFSGLIDEVRVYNRALSATEIQNDMNNAVGAPLPPDSVPPQVTVIAPAANATVTGQTTLYSEASDNIGVIGVQFFLDGSPLAAEVASAPFTIPWNSATATNGSHAITAVARDAANNLTTSNPITITVNNTNDPAVVGAWTAPFNWPIVAINLVVTRTGEVMSWDGPPSNGGSSAQLWNPTTGQFTAIPNNVTNMFCNAAVVLADGRIMAIGGHANIGVGIPNVDVFDPITKQWSPLTSMAHGRWYPTATVLPDGRVLVTSGSDDCYDCFVRIPEIYNPTTNQWTSLPAVPEPGLVLYYPLMFVLPDGRLLEAGDTETSGPTVTRVLDLDTLAWTTVDPVSREGHAPVMYEPGKVMKSGVTPDVGVTTAPSVSTTFTLDMTQPSPQWRQTPNMAFARAFHNQTLLPDGTVLATGGGTTRDGINYNSSVRAAELWSPVSKTWSTLSSAQQGRLYHSTTVLLLDGRVLVAGSGRNGPAPALNAEIFSPPYLFKGPRPTIPSTLADASYGSTFFVNTPDAASITSVTLLRLSATTHAFNMDQRFLRLNFSQVAGGLNVQAPANGNVAPPGYYALYVLNAAGVPSVGAVIRIH